jgi:hypothetical protein
VCFEGNNVVRKSAADEQNLAFMKDEATWNLIIFIKRRTARRNNDARSTINNQVSTAVEQNAEKSPCPIQRRN